MADYEGYSQWDQTTGGPIEDDEKIQQETARNRFKRRYNPLPLEAYDGTCQCSPVIMEASPVYCGGCFSGNSKYNES